MELIHIVVLALVQGLTEFLPISSSAHLILVPQLLGWPDQGQAFDVAVHVGTLAAVCGYFHRDVYRMTRAWLRALMTGEPTGDSALAWAVIFGTVPAGLLGVAFADIIELYLRHPLVIAAATVVFGLLLWFASWRYHGSRGVGDVGWRDALFIGCMQAVALIPGTSRSGITITAGLMVGLTATAAARFSFLLSIPLIAAAGTLHALELIDAGISADWTAVTVGALVAALAAVACIHAFLALLERVGMLPFIVYRLALGVLLLYVFS